MHEPRHEVGEAADRARAAAPAKLGRSGSLPTCTVSPGMNARGQRERIRAVAVAVLDADDRLRVEAHNVRDHRMRQAHGRHLRDVIELTRSRASAVASITWR